MTAWREGFEGREGERQEAQPYQCLRGDPNSFKNIQATYTHTHSNAGPETASGTHEKRPCIRQESVLKGIVHSAENYHNYHYLLMLFQPRKLLVFFIGMQKEHF